MLDYNKIKNIEKFADFLQRNSQSFAEKFAEQKYYESSIFRLLTKFICQQSENRYVTISIFLHTIV